VKEFLKSVSIWQRCGQKLVGRNRFFFLAHAHDVRVHSAQAQTVSNALSVEIK